MSGIFVTVLFVAMHLSEVLGYWPALLSVAVLGAATLLIRIVTNSLAPAILLHASYNLVLVLAAYAGTD